MNRLATWLLAAAAFFAPWASVDLLGSLTGRGASFGLQPAVAALALLVLVSAAQALRDRRIRDGEIAVVVALLWMVAASSLTWSVDSAGLAGASPWSKSLKQLVQWGFLAVAGLAVARRIEGGVPAPVERGLAFGLLVACVVSLVVALAGPGAVPLLDTNPSIASGSDELYLGHSFTGIARLRGPMPEPLMFGSYLLAVVPMVAFAGLSRSGRARWWRCAVALAGASCLLGTWSRGAWLGAAAIAGAIVVAWMRGSFGEVSRRRVSIVLGGGVLVAWAGFALMLQVAPWDVPGLFADRLAQSGAGHDMSNMTRVWAWRAGLDLFLSAPLLGHGWGSFGFLFYTVAPDLASGAHFGWPVPNNLGLLLLAETGLTGFVLWCVALAPAFRLRGAGAERVLVACAIAGVLVHLATFSQWNLPHLWLLFGIGIGLARGGTSCVS